METNEKTIDLLNVFNYVKCQVKQIVIVTVVFMILGLGVGVLKDMKTDSSNDKTVVTDSIEVIDENETYYYSTAKILFKCDSVQSVEKKYDVTSGQLQVQEVNEKNTNCAFLNNSSLIFSSDTVLIKLMDKYDFKGDLSEFKENVKVDRLDGTDVVRVVVRANEPEVAEEMVNLIVKHGIEETDELYQLNYKVIDQYTDYDNSFTDLEKCFVVEDEKGADEDGISSAVVDGKSSNVIKNGIISSLLGFVLSVFYFSLKFIMNNKAENIIDLENDLGVSTLQALAKGNNDYSMTASKIINMGCKSILLTNVGLDSDLVNDAECITKAMKNKGKKSLLIVVSEEKGNVSKDGILFVGYDCLESTLKENVKMYDSIFVVSTDARNNAETILVSKLVDFVVVIIKCNSVKTDDLQRTCNDFSKYGKNIDAIVMKDITKDSSSYKYAK